MYSRGTLQFSPQPFPIPSGTVVAWASLISLLSMTGLLGLTRTAQAQTPTLAPVRVIVNSNLDGEIEADDVLTLREAISLTNGTLNKNDLSPTEQAQLFTSQGHSRIDFDLPRADTTIRLQSILPAITQAGLVIDGTSQTGFASEDGELSVPTPVVALTPASDAEVFRGLTIAADQVQIRGLSLYGFTAKLETTATTPPADIFISHRLLPAKRLQEGNPEVSYPHEDQRDVPPRGAVIEANWLGMAPSAAETSSSPRSAFGVSIYNAVGTRILNNRIANHDGSAIISSVQAEQTEIANNLIERNGLAGMPDAIRLEGKIGGTIIRANQITKNAGSGIYLFKPDGAVMVENNRIIGNGQRLQRAAILLMGSHHQVIGNTIQDQMGPGVVVAAYPESDRNLIEDNRFANLDGLSIDLVGRGNRLLKQFSRLSINPVDLAANTSTGVQNYQVGDGPNPPRNSDQRQQDMANRGINTPEFLSSEFFIFDNQVNIDGTADPGARVVLYKVNEANSKRGPLNEPLAEGVADEAGRFAITLSKFQPGDQLSAIATHPEYGTSEPALNAVIRTTSSATPEPEVTSAAPPDCKPESVSVPISGQPPSLIHLPPFVGDRSCAGRPTPRFTGGTVRGKTEQSVQNHGL